LTLLGRMVPEFAHNAEGEVRAEGVASE
jgi:hypothetical protein